MLWRVPLDLGGWSCIALLLIWVFPPAGPLNKFEEFHFFGTWIPRILGQPLAWAFGYWMVSWSMYGCGNPFKLFFLRNIRTTFLPPFYFDPSARISSFWSFKPFDFCIHAFPALFRVSELTCELWISLEISQGQFLTPTPQIQINTFPVAQRLPRFLYMVTTLYLSKLHPPLPRWPYPFPHLLSHILCPHFIAPSATPPLYMYVS